MVATKAGRGLKTSDLSHFLLSVFKCNVLGSNDIE